MPESLAEVLTWPSSRSAAGRLRRPAFWKRATIRLIHNGRKHMYKANRLQLVLRGFLVMALLAALPPTAAHAASIVVNTTDDELNGDGDCSLREAITAANTNAAVDACIPGMGADTINFNVTIPVVIMLGSTLPDISDDLSIA